MQAQQNIMRREAERAMSQVANTRIGIVSGYDPNNYAAKVRIQPEDVETGWLPVTTPWSGNGWGLFCPPSLNDVVDVHFQEGGKEAGFVALRHFGDRIRPLPVASGEFWLVHKSGSNFKFHNDGTVELNAATAITSSAPIWNHTGNVHVQGDIRASGEIYDEDGLHGNIGHFRTVFNAHHHYGVQSGPDVSGITDELI